MLEKRQREKLLCLNYSIQLMNFSKRGDLKAAGTATLVTTVVSHHFITGDEHISFLSFYWKPVRCD